MLLHNSECFVMMTCTFPEGSLQAYDEVLNGYKSSLV